MIYDKMQISITIDEKNKIKFIPETKTRDNHVETIKIVWPISGCKTNKKIIGKIKKKLIRYFKYKFSNFWKLNIVPNITISNGLRNSIGWKRGKKPISIHLLDPLISVPNKGTKIKDINEKINNAIHIKINFSFLKMEKKISIKKLNITKVKCLIKK